MMNDELMDMIRVSCDECACEAAEAQIEHDRGEREREREEGWAHLVAIHGPLMTDAAWQQYLVEYGDYLDMAWKD